MNNKRQVRVISKFFIGFGVFGQALLTGLSTSYILYFGTDILGVTALALSNLLLISKLFDGLSDLAMGVIIDRTKSRAGKARPWIARAVIPFSLFSVLIFVAPVQFNTPLKLVWLFIFYNLWALSYTALGISMQTLNIKLTNNEKEVNALSTILMFGSILGNVVINAVAVSALTSLSGGVSTFSQSGFIKFSVILGIVCIIGGFCTYFSTKEVSSDDQSAHTSTPDIKKAVKSLLHNKYWLLQLLNTFFIFFGLNARLAAMVYYGMYVLKTPGLITVLVIADNMPSLLTMPLALAITNRIGKRNASLIGLCLSMAGYALMIFNIYNLPLFIAGLVIKGICFAPVQGAGNAFIVDSATYGEWKFGVKTEGLAFSAISFANKVSSGLAGVVVGWVLTLTGYVAGAAQTSSAINGIIFLYIGITFLCSIGQILVFAFYNLDKKMPMIRNELLERSKTSSL